MLLFFLFIVLPVVELALLIRIGARIGAMPTLGLVIATGFLGAALARQQGLQVLRRVRAETRDGRMPTEALIDGLIILLAAVMLITPGVITDAVGLLCLVPATRGIVKTLLWRWLERQVQRGRAQVFVYTETSAARRQQGDIAAEYEILRDDDEARSLEGESRRTAGPRSQ